MREPLYVMATRGRENNMLYVDTMYDPDGSTAHEPGLATDPVEVLEEILTRSAADVSATETRQQERDASTSPARLEAEGDAIVAAHCARRNQIRATSLRLGRGI